MAGVVPTTDLVRLVPPASGRSWNRQVVGRKLCTEYASVYCSQRKRKRDNCLPVLEAQVFPAGPEGLCDVRRTAGPARKSACSHLHGESYGGCAR